LTERLWWTRSSFRFLSTTISNESFIKAYTLFNKKKYVEKIVRSARRAVSDQFGKVYQQIYIIVTQRFLIFFGKVYPT